MPVNSPYLPNIDAIADMSRGKLSAFADLRTDTGRAALRSCSIPCDHVPRRSWPLFRARGLLRGVIESFQREQTQ
jgi:hypothetical protein